MHVMRTIGRFMQFSGLFLLPAAMVLQWMKAISVAQLLVALVFGAAAFYLGRMLEGYGADGTSKK